MFRIQVNSMTLREMLGFVEGRKGGGGFEGGEGASKGEGGFEGEGGASEGRASEGNVLNEAPPSTFDLRPPPLLPKGWAQTQKKWGPEGWEAQNFALFFPFPATVSLFLCLSGGLSRGILVVF